MIHLVSRFLSFLFHPILLPFISIIILFQLPFYINYKYTAVYKQVIFIIIFLNTVVLPLLISLYLKKKNIIGSLEMKTGSERRIPYFLTTLVFVLTYFLLKGIDFPYIYLAFFRSVCITLILLFFLAALNYKVSAHMSGLGGLCGMLAVLSIEFSVNTSFLLYFFLVISGIVGSARLYLKAHTSYQILFGFLLGFLAQIILVF